MTQPRTDATQGGLFLVFEGGEGVGKSTQIAATAAWLTSLGHEVWVTREPGGTQISDRIREILLDPANAEMDPRTEALLYAASRAQLVAQGIRPALAAGKTVLCDRYIDSSVAYQGGARGLGEDRIRDLSMWATEDLEPDLVVLLGLDPALGLQRKGSELDRMEQQGDSFHEDVAESYRGIARRAPARYAVIEAVGDVDSIQARIREAILSAVPHVTGVGATD